MTGPLYPRIEKFPLLRNSQGDFFVCPLLPIQSKRQQLHIKQHKNSETLCGEYCDPKAQIVKRFPPENSKPSWEICSVCWETAKTMELLPLSESYTSIFGYYPTFSIGIDDWIRHWVRQFQERYLNRTIWRDFLDIIREQSTKFLPEKASSFIKPPVRRHHWDIKPMPSSKTRLEFKQEFSSQEFRRIKAGYLPKTMEEHWFIFCENQWIFFHEAWSGVCFFQMRLQKINNRYAVVETWVNHHSKQSIKDDISDVELLTDLLNTWLLGYNKFEISDDKRINS